MNLMLETHYRGARLTLEIDRSPAIRLWINGLLRDGAAGSTIPATLRVSTTVQTDYEWHEFIEGVVRFDGDHIQARLVANNHELASENYKRTVAS